MFFFLVLLSVPFTLALEWPVYIRTPSKVAADSPFEATLDAEVHNFDPQWCHAFRVYLAASYEDKRHYFYHSDCYLIHEQTLCDASIDIGDDYVYYKNTSFTVTIPASVGPSGKHYVLIARTLQTDGSYYGASLDSDVFELTGANGTWAAYQEEGLTLWGDDGTSCSGFACVKDCSDAAGMSWGESSNDTYQPCANACPSVSIDFENSSRGGQPTGALTTPSSCTIQPTASPTTTAHRTLNNPEPTPTEPLRVAGAVGVGTRLSLDMRSTALISLMTAVLPVVLR